VLKLSNMTKLRELLINNNQLTSIKLPNCDPKERSSKTFSSLETLNLRYNPIADETNMFNELDKLPALCRLSYLNQKVTEGGDSACIDTFYMAVGMIEKLTSFNRSEVDKTQRSDAMYEMWKKFANDYLNAGAEGDPKMDEFHQSHRCYSKLISKYGSPEQIILQQQRKRVTTIEVQFKNITNGKMYRKKVPLAMTTHTLYGLVYKIAALHTCTGMDFKSFKLYYLDAYNNNIKVYLDNLSKSLDYYSLSNGDVIYIEK
jgi:tubulin-specific chaperone E